MPADRLYTSDYKALPYWWEQAPLRALPAVPLPAEVEVAIVGSGYSGLAAALVTARGGRSTLVLEAEAAGQGCSTRNGGQVSTSIKPGYGELAAKHGPDRAVAIRREGFKALAFVEQLIQSEGIDCDWEVVGRFHAAHNPKQYAALESGLKDQQAGIEVPYRMVPREQQRGEIGSDHYHGGVVYPRHAALQPARFHAGLLDRVLKAGVTVADRTPVTGVERDGAGFRVATPRGTVKARDVLIATNGYTGGVTPWLRRRVIPIGSYIIATEELDPALAKELVPHNRVLTDSRKLVFYYRLSPDRRRMVFGGRVAATETDMQVSAPRLHAEMSRIFPQLKGSKVSHAWMGTVAYTFDTMPHLGKGPDGLWYCMGYCGSGVSLAPYFGTRMGQQILGQGEGATALDGLAFPTRPLYAGKPWFLPMAVRWYRLRDKLPV
jgi:glycine/D-amino acid oxidase-like deaminating enzyme